MVERYTNEAGTLQLQWDTDARGVILYALYSILPSGQMRLESTTEQGPFDTSLEIAQWVIRVVARLVPPASC
jgi:hypothetical protein